MFILGLYVGSVWLLLIFIGAHSWTFALSLREDFGLWLFSTASVVKNLATLKDRLMYFAKRCVWAFWETVGVLWFVSGYLPKFSWAQRWLDYENGVADLLLAGRVWLEEAWHGRVCLPSQFLPWPFCFLSAMPWEAPFCHGPLPHHPALKPVNDGQKLLQTGSQNKLLSLL